MAVVDIGTEELRKLIKKGQVEIIDVREPEEFAVINIKGSKLISMNELKERVQEIDWQKEVVFVCRSGSRSKLMAYMLDIPQDIKNLQYGIYDCFSQGSKDFLNVNKDLINKYF